MITSTSNSKVKWLRRLQRDRRFRAAEEVFIVEGHRAVNDAIGYLLTPVLLAITPDVDRSAFDDSRLMPVSAEVMAHISTLDTPPGVLAAFRMPNSQLPAQARHVLILDRLRDPGNVGTLLRSAAAAGSDAVILSPGTVDLYNPKVVRASMGALWRIPVVTADWSTIEEQLAAFSLWAADAGADTSYTEVKWEQKSGVIVGSEADGISAEARRAATGLITIPMTRATESLNAAVAGSIILFERQRQLYSHPRQ